LTAEFYETKSLIELELSKFVNSLDHKLAPQVEYALLSGGKRLRPLMVLLSAQSVGGDRKKAVKLALAFELAHTSSLVHDDIIDKDVFRRGKLALYNNWSANSAILTGDLLIACAVYLASGYGSRIIKIFSQATIELCQGEHIDLVLSPCSTEKEYFQMIESKSASLFHAAASCGALMGRASQKEFGCLSNFGKNFGIAYQLRDDLLDLEPSEGQVSKDLKKGRVTLPLIHLYSLSNSSEKKDINENLLTATKRNKIKSDSAIKTILKKLEETGSIIYAEKKLDEYFQLAMTNLVPLRDSPHKLSLLQMSRLLRREGNH
jgi:geranylgeranyl pyrophosphate synthase